MSFILSLKISHKFKIIAFWVKIPPPTKKQKHFKCIHQLEEWYVNFILKWRKRYVLKIGKHGILEINPLHPFKCIFTQLSFPLILVLFSIVQFEVSFYVLKLTNLCFYNCFYYFKSEKVIFSL